MARFKHSGNLGDIIYSLPAIQALGGGELYLNNSSEKILLKNVRMSHTMSDKMINQLIELLTTQPYIETVEKYEDQVIDYDLDLFREQLPFPQLAIVYLKLFQVSYNLRQPWLSNIEKKYVKDIVIQRTDRFLNKYYNLNWSVLRGFEDRCIFVGFDHEYDKFLKETGLKIKKYPEVTIKKFAEIINGCKLFIGNQSLGFALAEGLKKNRILDPYFPLPTAWPLSENSAFHLTPKIIRSFLEQDGFMVTQNYKIRNIGFFLIMLPFFCHEIMVKIIEKFQKRAGLAV